MNLEKPSRKVEWTSNFTSWNNISDDVVSFEVAAEDLALGPWHFLLKLNNKEGKYGTVFPSIGTEVGLYLGFRFYINDKLLGIFRANNIYPSFSDRTGDILDISGLGLGQEAFNKKCTEDKYPQYMADQIIYDQSSHIGLNDLSVAGGE